jgi:hypothetical protein
VDNAAGRRCRTGRLDCVEVTDALEQLGGIAARKPLLSMVSRQEL